MTYLQFIPEFIPMSELTLGSVLGEGEFGSVLRATHSVANEPSVQVAVKTLHMQHTDTNKKEFLSEAKLMMSLRHRCIVRLIGVSLVSYSKSNGFNKFFDDNLA